jgi:ribose/xylose/arabinose/galactoside ABC-type transport system permease subunit
MANIARGIIYVLTRGYSISISNPTILFFGAGNIGPIPLMAIIMGITIIAGMYVLDGTAFGTRVKAIGGNELLQNFQESVLPKIKLLFIQ